MQAVGPLMDKLGVTFGALFLDFVVNFQVECEFGMSTECLGTYHTSIWKVT